MSGRPAFVEWFLTASACVLLAGVGWYVYHLLGSVVRHDRAQKRSERSEEGLCPECGYDLRGSPDRCPECGLVLADAVYSEFEPNLNPRALREDWPQTEIAVRVPEVSELLETLYATSNAYEADLLSQQLEARGVWNRVDTKESRVLTGAYVQTVTDLSVVVSEQDLGIAREILRRFERS